MNEYIEILKIFILCILGVGFVHVPLPFMIYAIMVDSSARRLLDMNEEVRVFCSGVVFATMSILKAFFLFVMIYTVYYSTFLFERFTQ